MVQPVDQCQDLYLDEVSTAADLQPWPVKQDNKKY